MTRQWNYYRSNNSYLVFPSLYPDIDCLDLLRHNGTLLRNRPSATYISLGLRTTKTVSQVHPSNQPHWLSRLPFYLLPPFPNLPLLWSSDTQKTPSSVWSSLRVTDSKEPLLETIFGRHLFSEQEDLTGKLVPSSLPKRRLLGTVLITPYSHSRTPSTVSESTDPRNLPLSQSLDHTPPL